MKTHLDTTNCNEEIGMMWITWKRKRDRSQIRIGTNEMRADQEMRGACAPSGYLYDVDLSVQIQRDEMTGRLPCLVSYELIHICSSWSSIVQIICDRSSPIPDELSDPEQQHRHQHAEHKIDQPRSPHFAFLS